MKLFFPLLPLFAMSPPRLRKSLDQARSMVISQFGIVATSQTLASEAGAQVLEAGGNAVDAAIAANAVLGLVEPTSNGMGGDLFAIVYEAKTGKLHGLNASGWAPPGLTIDFLNQRHRQNAASRHLLGHGAGLRRGLGRTEKAVWNDAIRQAPCRGYLLR